MLCVTDNHNYMCQIRAKEFLDSNVNSPVIKKYRFFTKWPQISHTQTKRNFELEIDRPTASTL